MVRFYLSSLVRRVLRMSEGTRMEDHSILRCTAFPSIILVSLGAACASSHAVIFSSTGDPSFNTTAPTGELAGSGWQYLGIWQKVLGTPIGPEHFLTSSHVGGAPGDVFSFGGVDYVADSFTHVPGSDLYIWHVTTPFPLWAPLYMGDDEAGREIVVFGRGTQRGNAVYADSELRGWLWGDGDQVLRWGTNTVERIGQPEANFGELLIADFDFGLEISPTEGMLSSGDSGGPVFLQDDDGVWKLAGVNYSVSGNYYADEAGDGEFIGALFETSGFFLRDGQEYTPASGPSEFYSTRISAHQEFILAIVPEPSVWLSASMGGFAFLARRRRSNR